jgi:hypothetical protein
MQTNCFYKSWGGRSDLKIASAFQNGTGTWISFLGSGAFYICIIRK